MSFKLKEVTVAIVLLLLSSFQKIYAQLPSDFAGWAVEKESTLSVKGKSNVNSFQCSINRYTEKDTIVQIGNPSKSVALDGSLTMEIESFDCHSKLITSDLRKTLKSKEYPKMLIHFISIERLPESNKTELIKGMIEVELAGVVRRFELMYSFSKEASGKIKLVGGRSFCFSDFRLSPPKKLAGLVKIKDEFDVTFQLSLKAL